MNIRKWKRLLAIAVIGCAPMLNTGFDCINDPVNRFFDKISGDNDSPGSRLDDLIDDFEGLDD